MDERSTPKHDLSPAQRHSGRHLPDNLVLPVDAVRGELSAIDSAFN
jgi:hypothetical protein